jgi:uncharacterized protein
MDPRLIELLVCPLCKGPLKLVPKPQPGQGSELHCPFDRLAFPVRDGIPLMLESEARTLHESA